MKARSPWPLTEHSCVVELHLHVDDWLFVGSKNTSVATTKDIFKGFRGFNGHLGAAKDRIRTWHTP